MKKTIVLAAIFAAAGALYCQVSTAQNTKPQRQIVNQFNDDETMININENDAKYEIRMLGKNIVELRINGQLIPKEDYPEYETKIRKILAKVENDRRLAGEDRKRAELEMVKAEKLQKNAQDEMLKAEKQRKLSEQDRERAMLEMEKAKVEFEKASAQMAEMEEDRKRIYKESRLISKRTAEVEQAKEEALKARAQAEVARRQAEDDRKLLEELFGQLVDAKIVSNSDQIKSIELDEATLLVNGVKQSNTLHSTLLKISINKRHKSIRYQNDKNGTRLSVD